MSKTIGGVKTTYLVDDVANPTGYAQVVEERIKGVVQVAYGYGPMRAWAKYPAYQYGDGGWRTLSKTVVGAPSFSRSERVGYFVES